MVGDSRNDLLAARGLGRPLRPGQLRLHVGPRARAGRRHVIDHLADLPAAMARLRTLPAAP